MSLVKGIHHVALSCVGPEEFEKTKAFYGEVLGLKIARSWNGGIMFDTGCGIIEIFNNAESQLPQGVVRHFALATDDVDVCVKAVEGAGYKVTLQPCDISIPSSPAFPARIAFAVGPVGEEIEFFCEK